MRNIRKRQLRKELLAEGATQAELNHLLAIAGNLRLLHTDQVTPNNKSPDARWPRILKPVAFTAAGVALGAFLVISSQASLPTSWLYPAQKFSDMVAVEMHPEYRATVMMKRAQQVNQLVATHADPQVILATLADYSREASAYSAAQHANYAAFKYCKSNLVQAAAKASPRVREAIAASLHSPDET